MINVRIAEAIYWTGRYTERIINHTNLINVSLHSYLSWTENTTVQNDLWNRLLSVTGEDEKYAERYGAISTRNVLNHLTLDRKNTNSIFACTGYARENVRAMRQELPSALWETINAFYLWLNDEHNAKRIVSPYFKPYEFFKQIKDSFVLFHGLAEMTMVRNEEWRLMQLGRYIERAENISRIVLLMQRNTLEMREDIINNRYYQLTAALRSVDGLEAFRKFSADRMTIAEAARFLIGEPLFPRSIHYCMTIFKRNLEALEAPAENKLHSPLFDVVELLEYIEKCQESDYSNTNLTQLVNRMLYSLNSIATKVYKTYFQEVDTIL